MVGKMTSLFFLWCVCCVHMLVANAYMVPASKGWRFQQPNTRLHGKITPRENEGMDDYRRAVVNTLNANKSDGSFGGREILELLVKKWGVAYDIQLRKNTPFGEGSSNIYINVMWRYFGQKTFPMNEREYLEHLEAIGRYITSINKVDEFKDFVAQSRKRPNAYFGYAVGIPLNVDPSTADKFFKDLPYE